MVLLSSSNQISQKYLGRASVIADTHKTLRKLHAQGKEVAHRAMTMTYSYTLFNNCIGLLGHGTMLFCTQTPTIHMQRPHPLNIGSIFCRSSPYPSQLSNSWFQPYNSTPLIPCTDPKLHLQTVLQFRTWVP